MECFCRVWFLGWRSMDEDQPKLCRTERRNRLKTRRLRVHYHQEQIHLRKTNDALIDGEFKDLLPEHQAFVHAYERRLDANHFVIVLNQSDKNVLLPLSLNDNDVVLQNVLNNANKLQPQEARIYKILLKFFTTN